MTLNWGHKLILTFCLFAGFMGFLAYKCFNTNFDLVSKEYYKDELAYQQVIDGSNRANALSAAVSLQQEGENILLTLPKEMQGKTNKGNILFYCASDAKNDRKLDLNTNDQAQQNISAKSILPGNYTAKISWNTDGKFYYSEQNILIR